MANKNLGKRTCPDRDEFYTTAESAVKMINIIKPEYWRGKKVYCCCDSEKSEIVKMLKSRQEELGIKEVVHTCIEDGYDALSQECLDIAKRCDVVVTNPPFSNLQCYIDAYKDKDFVFLANGMALGYKRVKPLALGKKLSIAGRYAGGLWFARPNGDLARVNVFSLTNIDPKFIDLSHETKRIRKTRDELEKLGKLTYDDETGELNVDDIRNIPCDLRERETMTAPMSVTLDPWAKQNFDFLGFTPVKVNGKARFGRVRMVKL